MKIQARYFNPELAPMKYYKFLIWFSLPVGVLGNIFNTFSSISQYLSSAYPLSTAVDGISLGSLMGIDIIFFALSVALDIAALILLHRMDWRGVVALCGFYLAAAVYYGACVYIYVVLGGDYVTYIVRIIVFLLWGFLTWVYFCKRRPLFHTKPTQLLAEDETRKQWAAEQDERIAGMNIPNPYRPGTFFRSVDELQEYSNALRYASAHTSDSSSEPTAPVPEPAHDDREENEDSSREDESRYLIIDKSTGEVVAESVCNPFEAKVIQHERKANIFRRALKTDTSTKIIVALIIISLVVAIGRAINEAENEGYERGFDDGYFSGESDSYDEAFDDGYDNGYSVGFEEGSYNSINNMMNVQIFDYLWGNSDLSELLSYIEIYSGLPYADKQSTEEDRIIKIQFMQEINEQISEMQIPNPYRPGTYFGSIVDFAEYASALHQAEASRNSSN